jgi:hypothetical protein
MTGRHLFTSESVAEGHPGRTLCLEPFLGGPLYVLGSCNDMGRTIAPDVKSGLLPKLRSNFGRISQREAARLFGLGHTTVNRWYNEMGLKYEKFTCDESFFDNWTEESAYVLGYIFADGNVQCDPIESRWGLTITASEKDVAHLERVRQLLKITKSLLYAAKTRSYRLNIANRTLAKKLVKLGVVPRKSLIVEFPRVPTRYLRHFIRGVVDGDGSVFYFDRPRSPYFTIRVFSGSRKFLTGAGRAIMGQTGIPARVRMVHKNAYVLDYTCSRAERLGRWLYDDSHIFLERKHSQYTFMKARRGI